MLRIRVPSLAENVLEATIGLWRKAEGDPVAENEGIAELVTEKAQFTLESAGAGRLTARLAEEKSVLPVGFILALLDGTPADAEAARAENEQLLARRREEMGVAPAPASGPSTSAPRTAGSFRATPAARRLARERGVDLAALSARLGDRMIREEDVAAAEPGT